jgi:hypothetical protein
VDSDGIFDFLPFLIRAGGDGDFEAPLFEAREAAREAN